MSLLLIDALQVAPETAVIDIGGGGSSLVGALLDRSFGDVTVLDISATSLEASRQRIMDGRVHYLHQDVLSWEPHRRYGLWHDRALFHFLTNDDDRDAYVRALFRSVEPCGAVIVATFASDGPQHCSGLPVWRYSPEELARSLGDRFEPVETRREEHSTPSGNAQPFTWVAGRTRL
jgi:trans-aconitate methyltransferase